MTDRSLRRDLAGHPRLAYGGEHLWHAWDDGTGWYRTRVDDSPGLGTHAALAIAESGERHISYYDRLNGDLKYAYWDGEDWQITTVDDGAWVGEGCTLALEADGKLHMVYEDVALVDLKHAYAAKQVSPSDYVVYLPVVVR